MAAVYEKSAAWLRLNEKQRNFVREWCIHFNNTKAAVLAGYSSKTARAQGSRLFTDVDVQECIGLAMKDRAERTNTKADRVVQELERIAFQDIRNALTFRSVKVNSVDPDEDDIEDYDFDRDEDDPKTRKAKRKAALTEAETDADALHIVDLKLRDSDQLDDATAATIQSIQTDGKGGVKVKFHSKQAALDTLARHHGLLKPNAEDLAASAEALIAVLDERRNRVIGRRQDSSDERQGREARRQRPQRPGAGRDSRGAR